MSEKNQATLLKEKLFYTKKNGGLKLSEEEVGKAFAFCEEYKNFLDQGKTERGCVDYVIEKAKARGFTEFDPKKKYVAGDKVYVNNRNHAMILAVVGSDPIENGVNIIASHIDAPRVDLKQVALFEDTELAFFKTHYYGGVKKYQWVTIPLALSGVIIKADMTTVKVNIGEDEGDPSFCFTDLLPHLAQEQMKRPAPEVIRGEELNLLIGSLPFRSDEGSELVKLNIMNLLHEKYGILEEDFLSAELELVPAFKAKDIGFDRSMVGGYGQDDRVCAYTSVMATFDAVAPKRTIVTVLADKEEIGSVGATGLKGAYMRYFVENLAAPYGVEGRTVFSKSKCLSADVGAAYDPTFADVNEKRNTAYINYGAVVPKYLGSRGKGGSNDAPAEFVAEVRAMLNEGDVLWQTAELGKIDLGGGGTVAAYVAELDVDTIDIGVPVLSMHAPYEVTSKIDVYSTYRAFCVFTK